MDYREPGSSVHGIFQARILEWVPFSFSKESSRLGIKPMSPALQVDSLPLSQPRSQTLELFPPKLWLFLSLAYLGTG